MTNAAMAGEANSLEYVGFWARVGASLIDTIVLLLITYPLLYWIYGKEYWLSGVLIVGKADVAINWVFPLVATVLFWMYKSATPGKMVIRARVVDASTGHAPSFGQSIVRYLGYFVSVISLGLGFFWIGWDAKKQGWHDKMAGTVVVRPKGGGVEKVRFPESTA